MSQIPRLFPAWFVYETVIPLKAEDGWNQVEHRKNSKTGYRETTFIHGDEQHRITEYSLGAFGCTGYWFVSVPPGVNTPTWAVIDPATQKTFIITPQPARYLGRPITYSLPTDDIYNYPGEYVTNC